LLYILSSPKNYIDQAAIRQATKNRKSIAKKNKEKCKMRSKKFELL
jgi:hypothetical protein